MQWQVKQESVAIVKARDNKVASLKGAYLEMFTKGYSGTDWTVIGQSLGLYLAP